jgi:alpha-mannosidase
MKHTRSVVTVFVLLLAVWPSLFGQTTGVQQRSPAPGHLDLTRDTTLYTMGYSHLDTQWRWDYETTIRKYILSTMADNFRLIEKYPGYTFNFTGANRYMMMKEYYPTDYQRVKEYIAAGRWFPAGSSLEETDALIPSPESLIRNIFYGNRFFRKEFGKASNEYMVPDCFGFPASMPSIFVHAGLKGFSTQKLTWGSAVGVPFNFGLWVGTDGAPVIAALNPGEYGATVKEDLSSSPAWRQRIADNGKKSGIVADFMYFGTGDIGGAPAEESVQWVQKSLTGAGPIHVLSVPASRFFDDITPDKQSGLPRYRGEFLLTNHSAGSLTSQAYMKRWNRKNELLARSAEASSVVADWLGGAPYPREKMREAWRLVIGAQFHDVLSGTCTPRSYELSWNDEVLALKQFADGAASGIGAVARGMNTETSGIPLVVFNPLSIQREEIAEATLNVPAGSPGEVRVFGPDGNEVPSQTIARNGEKRTIVFAARVPSLGFSVYDVRPSATACSLPTGLTVTAGAIENGSYRVTLNAAGDVASIFDKRLGKELLSAPHRLEFRYERPLEWPAWNMDWEDRQKPSLGFVDGTPTVRIVEQGPARVSLEIDRESRGSRFIQRIRLGAGETGERVEFSTQIHWFTPTSSLKAAFPLTATNAVAAYNTGVGAVERGNNDPKKFEVPAHQWFDLTDKGGNFGVSILEDSRFGSDKPSDNMLRLTLVYTPGVRSGYRDQASQDFGIHTMLYAIVGHQGDWRTGGTQWQAARVNEPLIPFQAPRHKGSLGKSFSFLRISSPAVTVVALKKAEDEEKIIVRLLETTGKPAHNIHVSFAAAISNATEVNGQEQSLGSAKVDAGSLVCDLTAYQLKAFAVTLKSPARKLAPPVSQPVALTYNADVMSATSQKGDGQFGNSGLSLPAEMVPDSIVSEGVLFTLGPKGSGMSNAVACQGQTFVLPAGNFNRLYLLAASSAGDANAEFMVDGKPVPVSVGNWTGFVGQWDNRIWDGFVWKESDYTWDNILYEGLTPGYVKNGSVAWHTTHGHLSNGENDPYAYGYLYKVTLNVPRGAKKVVFPNAPGIMVFAATMAMNDNDASVPAVALHDTLNIPADQYVRFQMTPKPGFTPESCIVDSGTSISIATRDVKADIYYTLDGSVPTKNSARYAGPIRIDRPSTLSAIARAPGKNTSLVATATYHRSFDVTSASYLSHYSPKYRGNGDSTFIDGKRGTSSYANPAWQAFEGEDCSVILDLGQVRTVHSVTLGCLSEMGSWIFYPVSISAGLSQDGKTFGKDVTRDLGVPTSMEDSGVKDIPVEVGGVAGRYVRVTAKNIGTCPVWHPGAGGKAWIFMDEIFVE